MQRIFHFKAALIERLYQYLREVEVVSTLMRSGGRKVIILKTALCKID